MIPDSNPPGSNPPGPPAETSAASGPRPSATLPDEAPLDWRYWARRLLVCNPFFLCSAALLLFGVNRLSIDPTFLGDEIHNLLFNFFALQFYEVLVVGAAIVLARRRIWYDSALLVVLENGLVLVPFMLISQATLQGDDMKLAWTLALAGGWVAIGRFTGIKRLYGRFNLPWRALLMGGAILAANVALPLVFRPRMELDVADWQGPNLFLWLVVLPMIAAGANLLGRPARYGGLNPERHWLPIFVHGLWTAGSAVHVWCVAHICDLPLELHHLAPMACVAAWTMWNRLSDCLPTPSARLQKAMLMLTAAAPLLAFGHPRLFVVLAVLNFGGYVALSIGARDHTRAMARQLALVTLGLMVAGIPEEWGREFLAGFTRAHGLVLGWSFYLVLLGLRSARPEAGLFGAVAAGVDVGWLARDVGVHIGLQSGLVFLLLHSLRWRDAEHAGARLLRWLAAIGWALDAILWTTGGAWLAAGVTGGGALFVITGWLAAWWIRAERGPWVIPGAAAIALLAAPANWFTRFGSDGLLAVVGSFVLFAIGIVVAWTRHRWEHRVGGPRGSES